MSVLKTAITARENGFAQGMRDQNEEMVQTQEQARAIYLGRHFFGAASIAFAAIAMVWRQFNGWEQIHPLSNVAHPGVLLFLAAALQLYSCETPRGWEPRRWAAFISSLREHNDYDPIC